MHPIKKYAWKPLYIQRYYIQKSHDVPHVYEKLIALATVYTCIYYGKVYHSHETLSCGIPWNILLATWIRSTDLKSCVYT